MAINILVVDDEPDIRLLYRSELEDQGFKVFEASGSEECFDHLEKNTKLTLYCLTSNLKAKAE